MYLLVSILTIILIVISQITVYKYKTTISYND